MGLKYRVNQKFFDVWTPEMAYILGFFYADGSLEYAPTIRGKYVRFTSCDKDILMLIKNALHSDHPLHMRTPQSGNNSFMLRIGDQILFERLQTFGATTNKSLTMKFPNVPKDYLSDFLRGYFDGDGCVFIEYKKLVNGSKSVKRLHTSFTSGSNRFLEEIHYLLKSKLSIESKLYKNNNTYQIRYNTKSSIKLFTFLYQNTNNKIMLNRKYNKFKLYFSLRKNWIDSPIQSILNATP